MATIIKVVQNDKNYSIPFVLQNNDGTPFNLAGFALSLVVQAANTPGTKFTGAMVIDDAANGKCHYVPAATDFDQPGKYLAQIQVINSGNGEQVTFADIEIQATAALPTF